MVNRTFLWSDMNAHCVLMLLLVVSLGRPWAAGKEPIVVGESSVLPARRQLQQWSLFDPLADLLSAQEQQKHSLMHMISGHRATDSIPEYSSSNPFGLDAAEAMLEDQPQVQVNDLNKSPQHARLHSLARSQALAKSKSGSQPPDASSSTAHTGPPTSAVLPESEPAGRNALTLLSKGGSPSPASPDCTALIEHEAVLSCLIRRLAALNAELEALSTSSPPQSVDELDLAGKMQNRSQVAGQSRVPSSDRVTWDDLVSVAPSDWQHMPLVKAMRGWRKGMRGVIAFAREQDERARRESAAANETWLAYPDDNPVRTVISGADSRAALAPLLAHQALGDTYKWMLYGDDDTLFFVDAVLDLLQPFDPELPYAISDNIWFEANSALGPPYKHPSFNAPRCLPCHFKHPPKTLKLFTGFRPEGASLKPPLWGFPAVPGCPCTPELLCSIEEERPLYGVAGSGCTNPPAPKAATYAVHGGAGVLLSVGLMRKLDFTQFEACVKSLHSSGGDAFFTICLWRAGFALTDPGYSVFNPDAKLFDPFQYEWHHDVDGELRILEAMDKDQGLVEGGCNATCQVRLNMMVSAHVRSRARGIPYAAAQLGILSAAYDQRRTRLAKSWQKTPPPPA